jgi:hypothetical protein
MTEQPATGYFAPADRFMQILIGVIVLAASAVMVYYGARGLWMFLQGSPSETASPVGWVIGLGAGGWGGYAGCRMVFGWKRDRPLVPTFLLYLSGALCLLGALSALLLRVERAGSMAMAVGSLGVAAIMLAWRRRSPLQ